MEPDVGRRGVGWELSLRQALVSCPLLPSWGWADHEVVQLPKHAGALVLKFIHLGGRQAGVSESHRDVCSLRIAAVVDTVDDDMNLRQLVQGRRRLRRRPGFQDWHTQRCHRPTSISKSRGKEPSGSAGHWSECPVHQQVVSQSTSSISESRGKQPSGSARHWSGCPVHRQVVSQSTSCSSTSHARVTGSSAACPSWLHHMRHGALRFLIHNKSAEASADS